MHSLKDRTQPAAVVTVAPPGVQAGSSATRESVALLAHI